MASSPNIDGMLDIRSLAILQDVSVSDYNCLTAAELIARGPFYRRVSRAILSAFTEENPLPGPYDISYEEEVMGAQGQSDGEEQEVAPRRRELPPIPDPFFTVEEEELDPEMSQYDNEYSWICCYCSVAIIFVIFGTIFSYAALHVQIRLTYGLSYTETILTGAACFAIFVLVGPVTTCVIKSLGYRSTAIFGLLMVFIGLILEGFITHFLLFYISRLVLIPIGGGFAHTASHYMSSFFELQIMYAVLMLCVSSILGVIIYTWFSILLQSIMTYKGIQVVFGLIILFAMTLTHVFPKKMNKQVTEERSRNLQLQDCIKSKVRKDVIKRAGRAATNYNEDSTVELKSCLCVCVCELGTVCDKGFFLWAGITMMASLTVTVPYLFLYLLHLRLNFIGVPNSQLKLFFAFSMTNLLGRFFLIFYNDHTYAFNRGAFQFALAGTGVIMIFATRIQTYGWLALWMVGMGIFQGLMSVTIPRVTLQAVQRQWLKKAWILIVTIDAIGSFLGPALMITLRYVHFTMEFKMPTIIIGTLQIVAVLLAFLVPNDEDNYKDIPPQKNEASDDLSGPSFQPGMASGAPDRFESTGSPFPSSVSPSSQFMNFLNRPMPSTFGILGSNGGGRWESLGACASDSSYRFQNLDLTSSWSHYSRSARDLWAWRYLDDTIP